MRLDQFARMFENQPWMTEAACKGMPASVFIPDVPDRGDRQSHRRYQRALEVCKGCPVTAECKEYGRDERRGVWGGTTPTDRNPPASCPGTVSTRHAGRAPTPLPGRDTAMRSLQGGAHQSEDDTQSRSKGDGMTSPQARKGRNAELAVAAYLATAGFPNAEPTRRSGWADDRGDIDGIPGVVIEVKNAKRIELAAWLAETEAEVTNAKAVTGLLVVKRRLHADPADWYAITRLGDWCALAKDAGL